MVGLEGYRFKRLVRKRFPHDVAGIEVPGYPGAIVQLQGPEHGLAFGSGGESAGPAVHDPGASKLGER